MRELIHEIGSTLRNNKLRTALTGFAVSWGIFLLICLLGAGNGLMNSFMGSMEDYISQAIRVEGWRTSKPYAGYKEGRTIQLDQQDVAFTEGPRWEGVIGDVTPATSSKDFTLTRSGNTHANALAAQAKYLSSGEAESAAEDAFRLTRAKYENGKTSITEFNEARTRLLKARSDRAQAACEYLFQSHLLDFYRGGALDL